MIFLVEYHIQYYIYVTNLINNIMYFTIYLFIITYITIISITSITIIIYIYIYNIIVLYFLKIHINIFIPLYSNWYSDTYNMYSIYLKFNSIYKKCI